MLNGLGHSIFNDFVYFFHLRACALRFLLVNETSFMTKFWPNCNCKSQNWKNSGQPFFNFPYSSVLPTRAPCVEAVGLWYFSQFCDYIVVAEIDFHKFENKGYFCETEKKTVLR